MALYLNWTAPSIKSPPITSGNNSSPFNDRTPPSETVLQTLAKKVYNLFSLLTQHLISLLTTSTRKPPDLSKSTRFPSLEDLVSCLNKYCLTNIKGNSYLAEKGVIKAVAGFFANTEKSSDQVALDLELCLTDLKLNPISLGIIRMLLSKALEKCAVK